MKLFGISYNASTDQGFSVGAPDEGFDITAVAFSLEQMENYVKEKVTGDDGGEITFSTTHDAVGEHLEQIGANDVPVVAVVYETFMDEGEEITIPICLVYSFDTELLS